MKRFILTGAPGSGKTAIIRQLEVEGFSVVEEAATDVIALEQAKGIAEPWMHGSITEKIAELQRQRQICASQAAEGLQFYDRSPICTLALAKCLGHPVTDVLSRELDRIKAQNIFQENVFFLRNLGFIKQTEARRITFDETVRFEKIHEETYKEYGFTLVFIGPGTLLERVAVIKTAVRLH